jgi:patatin-like phospholipase/acyl hydrolase
MPSPSASSLRILSLDGGGVKGYTSLIILQRILRTLKDVAGLENEPRPFEVFDLIVGTSTGGLIAIMLGRLEMSIDEAIKQYEEVGKEVFGNPPAFGLLGKFAKGMINSKFYDIKALQKCVKDLLRKKGIGVDEQFCIEESPSCKVYVSSMLVQFS